MTGAQHRAAQWLQFFLSESRWDADRVDSRRLELLRADPATAPYDGGVLVIDDSGDREDGPKTAHVGRRWLGRYGKTDNGVVTVTTVWADERVYYPVHVVPCTPAMHFSKGKNDPGFRTKLKIGADLAIMAREAGSGFRAAVADCAYGDQDGFRAGLAEAGLPFVMALKPRRGTLGLRPGRAHSGRAHALAWGGPEEPGDWHPVTRTFRGGPTDTWWAADARLGAWGPDGARAPGGGHSRPAHPAGQGHLVPGHQPAPPRRPPCGRQPAPSGPPGRDRAPVRDPQLDRAELQAGQG